MPENTPTNKSHTGVIWLLIAAAFVVILNETIMSVAIPVLMHDLRIDAQTAQWLSTGFMLAMAVVIPLTGFLLERLTTRTVFIMAMSLFCAGTLLAGVAPGFVVLLLARLVQASGTAIMFPLLMTSILSLVPIERRGQVMGNVSIVISVAPALGPTISGLILQFLSWRWIFFFVLPIAAAMLVLGAVKLVNVSETRKVPVDLASVALSAIGFGALIYGLSQVLIPALAVGAVALALFVWRQLVLQRQDRPLLDLRTFAFRDFTFAIGVMMIAFAGLLGVAILWPIYLQNVHGLSTVTTGLLLLPGGLAMGLLGPWVGRLYDRFGPRVLAVPGAILLTLALASMTLVTAETPLWILLAMHVTVSLALAFIFTPMFTAGLNVLPPHLYSHGSAILGTLQQVAGAAGTATLVSVMAITSDALMRTGTPPVAAQLHGITQAFWVAVGLAAGAVVCALFVHGAKAEGDVADTTQQEAAAEAGVH